MDLLTRLKTNNREIGEFKGKDIPENLRGEFDNGIRIRGFDSIGLPLWEHKKQTKISEKEDNKNNK